MSSSSTEESKEKSTWISRNKNTVLFFVRILGDIIALGLWFFHLIPEEYTKTGEGGSLNQNGLVAIILIGIALIVSIISNIVLRISFKKEHNLTNTQNEKKTEILNDEIRQLKDQIDQEKILGLRNKRYVEVFQQLKSINSHIHNIIRSAEYTKSALAEKFKDYCNSLSKLFTSIVDQECHVSVKIFTWENEKLIIRTFARDKLKLERTEVDHKLAIEHTIEHNTDYQHIFANFEKEGYYFLCNDLVSHEHYMNTSFLLHGETHMFTSRSLMEREEKWPLKYKSTIVVPICPSIFEERKLDNVIGFLCVDCASKDAFKEDIDLEILFGCADLIYNPLKSIHTKKEVANGQNSEIAASQN